MKVRILGNTLRFRLKQPEVSNFQQSGKAMEVMEFGPALSDQICFCLEISSDSQLAINFQANTITVLVPKIQAEKWTTTDLVGFNEKIDTGKDRMIDVLIEKDFRCLDGSEEDNIGSYPNPQSNC